MSDQQRLLVVGGSGFIGCHVVVHGVSRGYCVSVLSISPPSKELCQKGVEYLSADLGDAKAVSTVLSDRQFEYVINLGGSINHAKYCEGGREVLDVHFGGVLNLVPALDWKALFGFVQIGSSDEYGDASAPQNEAQREAPISPYSLGKLAATQFLQMLYRTEGFPVTALRLFLVYGPGQDQQRFLPQIIMGCLHGRVFPTSEGMQLRDFCYVDDVVDGIYAALTSSSTHGEVFNLGSGYPRSIRSMIEHVVQLVGAGTPRFGDVPYRQGENMALYADISRITERLGWEPQVSLNDGLTRTITAYRDFVVNEEK